MSQYGAYGFAQNGSGLPRHPRPLLHGHRDRDARPATSACACCCSRRGARRRSPAPCAPGGGGSRRARPTSCAAAGAAVQLRSARGKRLGTYSALRVTGRGGMVTLRGRAANGRVNGAYRGAIDFSPGRVLGRRRRQRARARHLPARRGAGRVAAVVADRGAQGAGRRRPHLRDRDDEAGRRLRPLPRHALAGLRRRRGRGGLDQPGDRRDARRGRHLQRRAGRHLLLLDLGRAHRGRREHAAGQRAAAVAEVRRRSLRRRVPAPPLGPDPDDARARRRQARLAGQGQVPRHRGRAARPARRGSSRPT